MRIGLSDDEINTICYHIKSHENQISIPDEPSCSSTNGPSSKCLANAQSKQRESDENLKLCIICNKLKFKSEIKLYRISETKQAIKLNLDDVYARCSTYFLSLVS